LLESAGDEQELVVDGVLADTFDELAAGVVEVVEECVSSPPDDCADLRARAEVEAARWTDDFIADDVVRNQDVATQQSMFVFAEALAGAIADALLSTPSLPRP
jgi:hypothetical protein